MDRIVEEIVEHRLGRLAGGAAFVLMLLRLGRLLDHGSQAPAWRLIMIASAILGGVIWWLVSQTINDARIRVSVFALAGLALFFRIAVPDTLIGGFIPGGGTLPALGKELAQTLDLIHFGVAPVFPSPGVVAVLAVAMWATGALFAWGSQAGPTLALVLPSIGLYLQFAVMDRIPAGRGWMAASAIVIALGITALAIERQSDAGRARDLQGRPMARRAGSMALVVTLVVAAGSVALASSAAPLVPADGNVSWRLGSGYGFGSGGVSFNRLADLQQSIIRRTNAVLFRATVDDQAPPADQIYWRMESLDVFDGTAWRPGTEPTRFYQPGVGGGDPAYAYRGSSQVIAQRIRIDQLKSPVIPVAGIGQYFRSGSVNVNGFQITVDGAAIYQPELVKGDQYEVQSTLALSHDDLDSLATLPDGTLSPLFAKAAEAGATDISAGTPATDLGRPSDIDRFLQLPDNLPQELGAIAREQTKGAATVFEEAWLLQSWFRDSDREGDHFTYSTSVTTGHDSLDLVAWLTDPDSVNYRTGYCEQFAAAMAILGRSLDIPSRVVWGFTPGEVQEQEDGSEVIVVTDHNAHAWVEMWIDGFGWVQFDPTPRGDGATPPSITAAFNPDQFLPPPDERTVIAPPISGNFGGEDPRNQIDLSDNPVDNPSSGLSWGDWTTPLGIVIVLVALLASIPGIKAIRRRRRLARLRHGDITAAWDEIVDRLSDLGEPVAEHQTPLEFATATDRSLIPLARSYAAAVYGGMNGEGDESDLDVVESWLRLRFDGGARAVAAFNPRSIIDRRRGSRT